jgi:hypothetical protein
MYIVLTKTDEGWANIWTETLPDGTELDFKFQTKEEAQMEIEELVEEMGYDPEDYRIEQIP